MIPASVLVKLATLGLSEEQAVAVADMLSAVEASTREEAGAAVEARRAADRERKARQRHVTSRDVTGQDVTARDNPSSPEVSPHTPLPNTSILIPPSPPTGALPPRGTEPRAGRGRRIPDDFQPDLDWAVENGMRPEVVLVEAAKFVDHWCSASGQTAVKRDWPATWRNWVRRALERTPQRNARSPPARRENLLDELDRRFPRQEARHDHGYHAGPTLEASRAGRDRDRSAPALQLTEAAGG